MRRVLSVLLVLLVVGVSAAAGYVVHTPLTLLRDRLPATLTARPEAMLRDAGITPDPAARLAGGTGRRAETGLGWRLEGLSMAPPGVAYDVTVAGAFEGRSGLILAPATGAVHLRDGRFTIPAARLLKLPPERLTGVLTLRIEGARLGPGARRVEALRGQVVWQEAALVLDQRIDLGTLHGALSGADQGRIRLVVSGTGGDAALSGTVLLDPRARVADLDLTLRPAAEAPPTLSAILEGWGTREGETWRITRRIDLP